MENIPDRDDYRVAIICALGTESEAIEGIFNEIYDTSTRPWQKAKGDENTYSTGRIGRHYVVLAYLPGMGKVKAATCASSICTTFGNIKLAIVAGVCGGAPYTNDKGNIYLGDVVISTQVVQGDFGRETTSGFVPKTVAEGNIGLPPVPIRSFLHKLQTRKTCTSLEEKTKAYTITGLEYAGVEFPSSQTDNLFPPDYLHKHRHKNLIRQCNVCQQASYARCEQSQKLLCSQVGCNNEDQQRERSRAVDEGPSIFFGPICSTDSIKKNGVTRDQFINSHAVLAFEMEGAGAYEIVPTLIIKGVCDYADSHKNKSWQGYAAITAASACKALLEEWDNHSQQTSSTTRQDLPVTNNIDPDTLRSYLKSLDFSEPDSRLINIRIAHPRTCQWIFQCDEFKSWCTPQDAKLHNRILWIKGKPGSGKSTMMKHIFQNKERLFPGYTHASYFFHARGSQLQKTRLGMLRSLLHQLLSSNQKMLKKFVKMHPSRSNDSLEIRTWFIDDLESFLLIAAQEGWFRDSLLLIDALDECEISEARAIAAFLEDLANNAFSYTTFSLFICISIRYFPNIGLTKCIQFNLDERTEHLTDLDRYIADKLRVKDQALIHRLLKKANHVFLWTVLVVRNLNTAFDEGADNDTLMNILSETPEELHEIFRRLLGPAEEMPWSTIFMLQLVMFAFDPLDTVTLCRLVIARTNPSKLRSWCESGMTLERSQRYITTASRGLLETVTTHKRIVQFIHESVRDYLYYDLQPRRTLTTITVEEFQEVCHEEIAWACILGFEKVIDQPKRNSWNSWVSGSSRPFRYKSRHILNHVHGISDLEKQKALMKDYIKLLTKDSVQSFMELDEMASRTSSSFSSRTSSSFLADRILSQVIHMEDSGLQDSIESHRRSNLLVASLEAIDMHCNTVVKDSEFLHESPLNEAVLDQWLGGVQILLKYGARFKTDRKLQDNVLQNSIRHYRGLARTPSKSLNFEAIVKVLVQAIIADPNQSINNYPEGGWVPLAAAVRHGSDELISLILEAGADPNIEDRIYGLVPLAIAVRHRSDELISLILEAGADPNIEDRIYGSALDIAVQFQRRDIVEMLLAHGADPDQSLNMALKMEDVSLIRRLLEAGADANAAIDESSTYLMRAVRMGNVDVINLLLSHDADPNLRNELDNGDAWDAAAHFTIDLATYCNFDQYERRFANLQETRTLVEHDIRAKMLSLLNKAVSARKLEDAQIALQKIPGRAINRQQARQAIGSQFVEASGPYSISLDNLTSSP